MGCVLLGGCPYHHGARTEAFNGRRQCVGRHSITQVCNLHAAFSQSRAQGEQRKCVEFLRRAGEQYRALIESFSLSFAERFCNAFRCNMLGIDADLADLP